MIMKVFASQFLEKVSNENVPNINEWTWKPYDENIIKIYASGGSTASNESTYAAEKDNRSDTDRPNEGR